MRLTTNFQLLHINKKLQDIIFVTQNVIVVFYVNFASVALPLSRHCGIDPEKLFRFKL